MKKSLKNKYQDIKDEIWQAFVDDIKRLKPCPFCGDTPTLDICQTTDEDGFATWYASIRCHNCGCIMKDFDHFYEDAIEARLHSSMLIENWNNRVK